MRSALWLLVWFAGSTAQHDAKRAAVHALLDDWHKAAAEANEPRYFGYLAPDAAFLGTAATERWSVDEFRRFAKPYFDRGKAWSFKATRRAIGISKDGNTAWFDEDLETAELGPCRGSGVLVADGQTWKITQYVLSVPVPNEVFPDVKKMIEAALQAQKASDDKKRPNVLFLAIDDQNDWLGCLGGHPQVRTPYIDGLARRGTLFSNAHCQAPLCNPSRASLLTGLRPSSTGIYGLQPGIREVEQTKSHVTLPQTFTRAGYFTFTCGKIYHDGSIKQKDRAAEFQHWGAAPGMGKPARRFAKLPGEPHPLMDWGAFPSKDEDAADYQIADAAIAALRTAPADRPFFIAAGFRLPHVPCFAPQRWFDLYPDNQLTMPPIQAADRDDTPRFSWYLHWRLPEPRLSTLSDCGEWRPLVRAYLASSSFMDAQVGRVLDALDATGRSGRTIVVLWSDHGWHLGEKQITGKNTLWERSTRVPLVFAGPGIARGAHCRRPAELLDIFPTLLELADFPARSDLEGHSLVPQLRHSGAPREWPAITTHNQGNHAIRDERWRHIRYADGSEELYDLQADPNEWTNRAGDPTCAAAKRDLARWLPKIDKPPVPGSAHRILTYDSKTCDVVWEGKHVAGNDPIPTP